MCVSRGTSDIKGERERGELHTHHFPRGFLDGSAASVVVWHTLVAFLPLFRSLSVKKNEKTRCQEAPTPKPTRNRNRNSSKTCTAVVHTACNPLTYGSVTHGLSLSYTHAYHTPPTQSYAHPPPLSFSMVSCVLVSPLFFMKLRITPPKIQQQSNHFDTGVPCAEVPSSGSCTIHLTLSGTLDSPPHQSSR